LLVRGIAAAKAGSKQEATFFLEWVLRTEGAPDQHLEAWWWLSQVSNDPVEKRRYLEEVLARNPSDHRARRALAILDGRLKPETIVEADRIPERRPISVGEAPAERFTCPRCGGRSPAASDPWHPRTSEGRSLRLDWILYRQLSPSTCARLDRTRAFSRFDGPADC
jgi:hypothetical protein